MTRPFSTFQEVSRLYYQTYERMDDDELMQLHEQASREYYQAEAVMNCTRSILRQRKQNRQLYGQEG